MKVQELSVICLDVTDRCFADFKIDFIIFSLRDFCITKFQINILVVSSPILTDSSSLYHSTILSLFFSYLKLHLLICSYGLRTI